jgi:excisionase family DNA binding protein
MPETEQENRLDPSELDATEIEQVEQLLSALSQERHAKLIDPDGDTIEIPEPIYRHLVHVLRLIRGRRAIVSIPLDEAFTTQAAANFLGMSRQTFVNLIESGKIPHYMVGSHRRVTYGDLIKFQKERDSERGKALSQLAKEVAEAGLYFPEKEK